MKLYSHFLYKFLNFHTRPFCTGRENQKCQDLTPIYILICALCFVVLGTAGVDENQSLGSECTLVNSLPWGTTSFCIQRAAEIQPWVP